MIHNLPATLALSIYKTQLNHENSVAILATQFRRCYISNGIQLLLWQLSLYSCHFNSGNSVFALTTQFDNECWKFSYYLGNTIQ